MQAVSNELGKETAGTRSKLSKMVSGFDGEDGCRSRLSFELIYEPGEHPGDSKKTFFLGRNRCFLVAYRRSKAFLQAIMRGKLKFLVVQLVFETVGDAMERTRAILYELNFDMAEGLRDAAWIAQ